MNLTRQRVANIVGKRVYGEKSTMTGRQYYFHASPDPVRAVEDMNRVARLIAGTNINLVKIELTGMSAQRSGWSCGPWMRVTVAHDSNCKCKTCNPARKIHRPAWAWPMEAK